MNREKSEVSLAVAAKVLEQCVSLQKGEQVLLVFDNFGQPLTEAFVEAGEILMSGDISAHYVPIASQQRWAKRRSLPKTLRQNIIRADALITTLTDWDGCTRFRADLLRFAVSNGLRVLHLPGVNEEQFVKAVNPIDFRTLHASAQRLRDSLSGTSEITIVTHDRSGKEHRLKLNVNERDPHICGGIAHPGEIMNVPTGEVYIAPIENASQGTLVLNGTTGKEVVRAPAEIILSFRAGRLSLDDSRFSGHPVPQNFRRELDELSQADPTCLTLCEIGFGLNAAIKTLTGNEILDEKALGTAHIALGSNAPFGGMIEGDYHRDLVFFPSKVGLDRRTLRREWRKP